MWIGDLLYFEMLVERWRFFRTREGCSVSGREAIPLNTFTTFMEEAVNNFAMREVSTLENRFLAALGTCLHQMKLATQISR